MGCNHQLSVLVTRQRSFARVVQFVLACSVLGACTDFTAPSKLHPAVLESLTPTNLTGTVDTGVSPAPVVRVTDQHGNPMQGVEVAFNAMVDGSFRQVVVAQTDVNGTATVGTWKLNRRAGTNYLRARSEGLADVLFTATANPGPVAAITRAWTYDKGFAGGSVPLSLQVTDLFDNPITTLPVTFEIEGGGGSIVPAVAYATAAGEVRALWTLGALGQNSASVSVPGLERMTFTVTAIEPPAPGDIRYELDSIVMGRSSELPLFRSWIALGENGRFTTSMNGLAGEGSYTISGSDILFTYSDDFLNALGKSLDYWPAYFPGADNSDQESGVIQASSIRLPRCIGEDCYDSWWYFGKAGP